MDRSGRTCGECAWAERTPLGLRCARTAPSGDVGTCVIHDDDPACIDVEAPFDCASCGACCREAFDAVPVESTDLDTLIALAADVISHSDGFRELRRVPCAGGTRCSQLVGGPNTPYRCRAYDVRPSACRDLERGSSNCLLARTRIGLSAPVAS